MNSHTSAGFPLPAFVPESDAVPSPVAVALSDNGDAEEALFPQGIEGESSRVM